MRAADGSYRWFLCRALPARDAEGRIVRWAGSLVDIDDWTRAEEALRESEGRFRQLAESLPQLVWTCRADGWCDYFSPQWIAPASLKPSNWASVGYSNFIPTTSSQPSRLGIRLWRPASL